MAMRYSLIISGPLTKGYKKGRRGQVQGLEHLLGERNMREKGRNHQSLLGKGDLDQNT